MRFTLFAFVPSALMFLLYAAVPEGPRAVDQAGATALLGFVLFWLAVPFVFVYWAARIVRRVWRSSSSPAES